jgi:mono/diheme cytochrome c family protein
MSVPGSIWRVVALLPLMLAAASAGAQSGLTLASRGEAILSGDCAMCHAVSGTTGGPAYLAPSFYDIAQRADFRALRDSLQNDAVAGHPAMPRTSLSPIDVEAILTYLEAMARQDGR